MSAFESLQKCGHSSCLNGRNWGGNDASRTRKSDILYPSEVPSYTSCIGQALDRFLAIHHQIRLSPSKPHVHIQPSIYNLSSPLTYGPSSILLIRETNRCACHSMHSKSTTSMGSTRYDWLLFIIRLSATRFSRILCDI